MLRLAQLCKGYQDGSEYHSVLQGAELNLERGAQLALMERAALVKVRY